MKEHLNVFESPEVRLKYLRERTLTERFDMLMGLIKVNTMLSNVKVIKEVKR